MKKFDLFISHASEDKVDFIRPLAKKLTDSGLTIWFDEEILEVGDSLFKQINSGLKESRYAAVVLSPSFFRKHWPKQELEGLFSLESDSSKKILPIWYLVDQNDVKKEYPILANRVSIISSNGLEFVIDNILKVFSRHASESMKLGIELARLMELALLQKDEEYREQYDVLEKKVSKRIAELQFDEDLVNLVSATLSKRKTKGLNILRITIRETLLNIHSGTEANAFEFGFQVAMLSSHLAFLSSAIDGGMNISERTPLLLQAVGDIEICGNGFKYGDGIKKFRNSILPICQILHTVKLNRADQLLASANDIDKYIVDFMTMSGDIKGAFVS